MRTRKFIKILEELGWPRIYLVSIEQYHSIDGDVGPKQFRNEGYYGISSDYAPIIALGGGLVGRSYSNTIYHEIAHHLWPNKHHWWIEAFGEKMAGGGGRGKFCKKFDHTVDDLPPRDELLRLARLASRRFNEKRTRN